MLLGLDLSVLFFASVDDGSATPVQDENALGSDNEDEIRGGSHHSEVRDGDF